MLSVDTAIRCVETYEGYLRDGLDLTDDQLDILFEIYMSYRPIIIGHSLISQFIISMIFRGEWS